MDFFAIVLGIVHIGTVMAFCRCGSSEVVLYCLYVVVLLSWMMAMVRGLSLLLPVGFVVAVFVVGRMTCVSYLFLPSVVVNVSA